MDDPNFDSDGLINQILTGIPLNRLGEPEDLVGPVIFLASDAGAFVTGALIPVDGGNLALNAGGTKTW
jgi:NAD(P)-dependent dehydrogenase (short-subunit alcohol dehydrogenase family)